MTITVYRSDFVADDQWDTINRAAWFTDDEEDAMDYSEDGDTCYDYRLRGTERFADLDDPDVFALIEHIVEDSADAYGMTENMPAIRSILTDAGYSGIMVRHHVFDCLHYCAFNAGDISAGQTVEESEGVKL